MGKARTEFETPWFRVESELINDNGLEEKPFYRIVIPRNIMVVALTRDKKIILIRQYRQAIKSHTLELPSGYVDAGESPKQAATRELYEETGHVCKKLRLVGTYHPWTSRVRGTAFLFYGQEAVRDNNFQSKENIEVIPVSAKEIKELTIKGSFQQMQGLGILLLLKWKLKLDIDL